MQSTMPCNSYITTGTASPIGATTASVGGTVVDTGTSALIASGISYSKRMAVMFKSKFYNICGV